MMIMNIEKVLKEYRNKKSIVETTEARLEAYKQMLSDDYMHMYALLPYSGELGMPKSPYRCGSATEKAVTDIELNGEIVTQLIKDDNSRIFWIKLEIKQIEGALQALTPWEKHIIELKYFDKMSWRDIEINFNKRFPQKNDLTEGRLKQLNSEGTIKLTEILTPFYKQYESIFKVAS